MPKTRSSLALLLVVILFSVAVIARNSETTGYVTYYLHRTGVAGVLPEGKTMNMTAPSGEETTLSMTKGDYYYWYTDPPLTAGNITTGEWTLHVYILSLHSGNKGFFEVILVSQGGEFVYTIVSETSGPVVGEGSFWYNISKIGNSVEVTENDRVRLGLKFSKATTLHYDGATAQSRLEFTGEAPPPIPESLFGTLAFALIAFTVYILYSKRILIKFKQQ